MWLRFICAGGTAVSLAYLSRWHFEERFLRLKGKLSFSSPDRARVAVLDGAGICVEAKKL